MSNTTHHLDCPTCTMFSPNTPVCIKCGTELTSLQDVIDNMNDTHHFEDAIDDGDFDDMIL